MLRLKKLVVAWSFLFLLTPVPAQFCAWVAATILIAKLAIGTMFVSNPTIFNLITGGTYVGDHRSEFDLVLLFGASAVLTLLNYQQESMPKQQPA